MLPPSPIEVRLIRLGEAVALSVFLSLLGISLKRLWKVGPVLGAAPMVAYVSGYAHFLLDVWTRFGRIPLHLLAEPATLFVSSLTFLVVLRTFYVGLASRNYLEPHPELLRTFTEATRKVGVRAKLSVLDRGDPVVYTTISFTPRVVISVGALEGLGEEELAAVLYHELSHVKLGHMSLKVIYYATLVVAFLNPLQVRLYRMAINEMEKEADAMAASMVGGKALTSALVKLSEPLRY